MPAPQVVPYKELTLNITKDVMEHPRDLGKHLAERYHVTRATTSKVIRRLETEGWISRGGPSTHPVYSPGFKRRRTVLSALDGRLEEGALWEQQFAQYFSLAPNIRGIVQHGFTEMINNAIDHSGGSKVWAQITQDQEIIRVVVSDDGIGIFKRIATALQLPDLRQALFELAKGKFTTDPSNHSGEGVFFTSRMFDKFGIKANGLYFDHEHSKGDDVLVDAIPKTSGDGTTVSMSIALTSGRTTSEVFLQFMNAPDDYGFTRTVVPMRLAQYEGDQLISRSQAKRLIARFDRFKTVLLDFAGVPEIGQGFADEIFRVYARQHLEVELLPINMTEQVERMWRRAIQSEVGQVETPPPLVG
jgi:anti-sigma regulatory factor (Ser/Thr protein kinase)